MFKRTLALTSLLFLPIFSHATIVDLGTITRDTETGLDWLDVTETRGLSYNQVTAQMGVGGAYEGWRYATASEVDLLITHFGYTRISFCNYGVTHCDFNLSGDRISVENIIKTLGDTRDAVLDEIGHEYDTNDLGAAGVQALINEYLPNPGNSTTTTVSAIEDFEYVDRVTGLFASDSNDRVKVHDYGISRTFPHEQIGSFLVKTSPVADGDLAPLGNPDGVINAADYLIATRIAMGDLVATSLELEHGDLYPPGAPDGIIDLSDVLLILNLLMQ